MEETIQIGLLGSGTVGTGVVRVLRENLQEISEKIGASLAIKKVLVRDVNKKRPYLEGLAVTDNADEILEDPDISIIVEVMGGIHPAMEYMLKAMELGKCVVTANKDVVAQYGKDLFDIAEKRNVDFMFEASVGGGIPIITPLKQCLTANRLTEIMGIVNGTTNYMLTEMSDKGTDYATVLKAAQEKGYAEADPTADVEGLDAARKASILASLAFNTRVRLSDVSVEGITKITPGDIEYAKDLGYTVKLLAVGRDDEKGVDVRVHPVFLSKNHPLASVNGVFNAIFVRGNAIGEAMFYGPGAGSLPTASAVVSDIVEVARNMLGKCTGRILCTCFGQKKLCPIEDTVSSYYVRLLVDDKPGVLGTIATVFGKEGISLKSVVQTKRSVPDYAEIVAITHEVEHRNILLAEERLRQLPVVHEICNVIRVENDRR